MDYKQLYLLMVSGDNKERGQMHFRCMYSTVIKTFFSSGDENREGRLLKCCKS